MGRVPGDTFCRGQPPRAQNRAEEEREGTWVGGKQKIPGAEIFQEEVPCELRIKSGGKILFS